MISNELGPILWLTVIAAALGSTDCAPKEAHASSAATPTPVLVELFTSEGCSSCPPADALLADLEAKQPVNGALIVPLAFHVDYWNDLGWRDPFSAPQWTDRQRAYARAGDGSVYTPELVIDGRDSFVGSRGGHAQDSVGEAAKRPKAKVTLTLHDLRGAKSIGVVVGALPGGTATSDLLMALVDPHQVINVTAGENGGRALTHTAIVRSLRTVAAVPQPGGSFEIPLENAASAGRAVVFVQERGARSVVGVAMIGTLPDR